MFESETPRARRRMRILAVVLATLPCYCIGFIVWSLAPNPETATPTPTITQTGGSPSPVVSGTPLLVTSTISLTPTITFTPTSSLTPTVSEAKMKYGDATPGGYSGSMLGTIGVAQAGKIFTNAFDTTIDWTAATTLKTGASGLIVTSGNGATINGYVTDVPTVDYPFLGIQFAAAGI